MRAFLLLILAALLAVACPAAEPTPAPFAKQPLTLTHAQVLATIEQMRVLAVQAQADTTAAQQAQQQEHIAHLAAEASTKEARAQAEALGKAAATAAAERDAEKARANLWEKRAGRRLWTLIFVVVGLLAAIYAAGEPIQLGLQVAVHAMGKLITKALEWCLAFLA